MERFGWPMGPAYLNDVIGMDTAIQVSQIIAAGFPEHMKTRWQDPLLVMVDHKRYGQKNGIGFYRYEVDPARSEEHTSELQSLMRISYAVFCLKKNTKHTHM